MPHYDSSSAECLVFIFKEGLLSAVAHDLKIGVTYFDILFDDAGGALEATFDARSLRVLSAMKGGEEDHTALSSSNKAEIEKTIVERILEAGRFPTIRFTAPTLHPEHEACRVRGTLLINGRSHETEFVAQRREGRWVADVWLHQPDFGIKPYSAMLGMLRVKPDVQVRVSLPGSSAA